MTATKNWGACSCQCGQDITPGAQISVLSGEMYLFGHETLSFLPGEQIKKTTIQEEEKNTIADISDLPLFKQSCYTGAEQLELFN
jgi:hypothetical protein